MTAFRRPSLRLRIGRPAPPAGQSAAIFSVQYVFQIRKGQIRKGTQRRQGWFQVSRICPHFSRAGSHA